jgi:hypothetical protein
MTRLPMGCQDVPSRCGLRIELDRGFGVDLGRLESRRAGGGRPDPHDLDLIVGVEGTRADAHQDFSHQEGGLRVLA